MRFPLLEKAQIISPLSLSKCHAAQHHKQGHAWLEPSRFHPWLILRNSEAQPSATDAFVRRGLARDSSRMRLTPVDLLSSGIAARTAGFYCLDVLAVDGRRRRTSLTSDPLTSHRGEGVTDLFEDAGVAPGRDDPARIVLPGGKSAGTTRHGHSRMHHIENCVDIARKRPAPWSSSRLPLAPLCS